MLPAVPTARVAKTTSPVIETPKPVVLGKVSDKAVLPAVPTVTPTASVAKNTLLVTPTASELPRPVDFAKASNEQVAAATAKSTVTPTAAAVITPPPAPTKKHQISSEEMIAMLSDKLDIMIDKLATSNDLQDKILRYSHA